MHKRRVFSAAYIIYFLFICLVAFSASFPALADEHVLQKRPVSFEEVKYTTEPYTGQISIKCNGAEMPIPKFFNARNDNLFLRFSETSCNSKTFEIFIGIGADCNGENVCYTNFFARQKLTDVIQSALDGFFTQASKKISLDNNVDGYSIPVQVFAYPTPARIIWLNHGYLYVVGSKSGPESDLIKSANSFINNSKD